MNKSQPTEESQPKLNLYQKIIEIRKCVPFLKKDEQGYKYKYVPGVAILSAIHDRMNEIGLLLMPSASNKTYHTETVVNQKGEESQQRIIEAEMIMTWIDAESGEKLEVPWLLFGEQNDISKAFGSGLTYSERYYLLKALNIPTDEDDPDAKGKSFSHKPQTQRTPKTNRQATKLEDTPEAKRLTALKNAEPALYKQACTDKKIKPKKVLTLGEIKTVLQRATALWQIEQAKKKV